MVQNGGPNRVQQNPIHIISIYASENGRKISGWNIHWYIRHIVETVLSSYFCTSIKIIIIKYKIESGTLLDPYPLACMARAACTDSHFLANVHINTTDQSQSTSRLVRFMNCCLLVGRRWCNRRQRPLVLINSQCDKKDQWVTYTVALSDNSVKE